MRECVAAYTQLSLCTGTPHIQFNFWIHIITISCSCMCAVCARVSVFSRRRRIDRLFLAVFFSFKFSFVFFFSSAFAHRGRLSPTLCARFSVHIMICALIRLAAAVRRFVLDSFEICHANEYLVRRPTQQVTDASPRRTPFLSDGGDRSSQECERGFTAARVWSENGENRRDSHSPASWAFGERFRSKQSVLRKAFRYSSRLSAAIEEKRTGVRSFAWSETE